MFSFKISYQIYVLKMWMGKEIFAIMTLVSFKENSWIITKSWLKPQFDFCNFLKAD